MIYQDKKIRSFPRARFLTDVLIAAVEGGYPTYWAQLSDFSQYTPTIMIGPEPLYDDDLPYAYVTVHETDTDVVKIIGVDDIDRAFGLLSWPIHSSIRDRLTHAYRENYIRNVDAGDADIMLQLAVLGEVKYG